MSHEESAGREAAPLPVPRDPRASWTLDEWDQMWRPSMWLRRPPQPHQTHWWHVAAIVALISYANVVANEILDSNWHVLFNLGVLGVAIAIARHAEATWTDLGMRVDRIGRGLLVGGIVMAAIGIGMAVAVAIPDTRELFQDDRVTDSTTAEVLIQALVRIPLVTAFYEEALFRGVLFGMFVRRWPPLGAAVASSFVFGMWHILPTLDTLQTNPAGDLFSGILGVAAAAIGAVGGTMLAGFAFLWLRLRANSVAAPTLAHIATNSLALLAALLVVRFL
jgi:membrane protease YdiL (CAAX protease family)